MNPVAFLCPWCLDKESAEKPSPTSAPPAPPTESTSLNGRTVTLVGERLCWSDALLYCRRTNSDLLSLHSEEEQKQVARMLSSATFAITDGVWLGLRKYAIDKSVKDAEKILHTTHHFRYILQKTEKVMFPLLILCHLDCFKFIMTTENWTLRNTTCSVVTSQVLMGLSQSPHRKIREYSAVFTNLLTANSQEAERKDGVFRKASCPFLCCTNKLICIFANRKGLKSVTACPCIYLHCRYTWMLCKQLSTLQDKHLVGMVLFKC